MNWLLAACGGSLLVLTLVDLVWTTISLRHAGPLTRLGTDVLWRFLRRFSRHAAGRRLHWK